MMISCASGFKGVDYIIYRPSVCDTTYSIGVLRVTTYWRAASYVSCYGLVACRWICA